MSEIRERGRVQARAVVSRGGGRVAELDARALPHRVILRVLPSAIARRFDPEAAGELTAVFELRVTDPHAGAPARFQLRIAAARCEVAPGPAPDAGAAATVGAGDLIRMVTGAVSFPELLASGRLELAGDPFLALRFPSLFRLPARSMRQ
jgi:SCP-2 sterol transfer family